MKQDELKIKLGRFYKSISSNCMVRHITSKFTVRMAPMILLVVTVGALAQCGLSDPLALRENNTSFVAGLNIKQRIAFRIGQVECLKTLLSEGEYRNAQYGLGALHRGNYNRDISRFDFKQRIAFLLGQVQCLKIQSSQVQLQGTVYVPFLIRHNYNAVHY